MATFLSGRPARIFGATVLVSAAIAALLGASEAAAAGTPAGTTIVNSATATYRMGAAAPTTVMASVALTVDEVIAVRVSASALPQSVASPATLRALAFILTNVGNGSESFNVTAALAVGGDQFDPRPASVGLVFIDRDGDGQHSAADTAISGPVALAADQSLALLVVADIPADLADGAMGHAVLAAASTTPGAAGARPGTVLAGQGTGGVDALVGRGAGGPADSGADDAATGTFTVDGRNVAIAKAVLSVADAQGNVCAGTDRSTCLVPGGVVEYRVSVTVTSASGAVARGLLITDPIPANTTFVANSIKVNGSARSDAADTDSAACAGCGNATGTLTINLGDTTGTAAGVVTTIDYRVRIN